MKHHERPSRTELVLAWLPAVVVMSSIWAVSSTEVPISAIESFPLRDKGIHAVEYGLLGFLVSHATLRTWPRHAVWRRAAVGLLIAVAWGVLDEIHQAFVPGRTPDALDVLADFVGASVGVSLRVTAGHVAADLRRRSIRRPRVSDAGTNEEESWR